MGARRTTASPRTSTSSHKSAKPASKPVARSARRRAREFALQGLYGWLVGRGDAGAVDAHVRDLDGFSSCDVKHYEAVLHGCIDEAAALDKHIAQHVDRQTTALSPVEHAALLIGTYELLNCLDVPYRVAINEAVELTKRFGGTDGHKYVNGVLDKLAARLRPTESRRSMA